MIRRLWIAAVLLLAPVNALADSTDIERRCTEQYPSVTQYFAWKDCVKTAIKREADEELARRKEEQARPCIAADLSRMEGLAKKVAEAVKPGQSPEEVQSLLSLILGYPGAIQMPDDNIKERVLVHSIQNKCGAPFRLLINVRWDSSAELRWLRTWALDAPAGYQANLHPEFSVEFEEQRKLEMARAQSAKRDAEFRAEMDKMEKAREDQRQKRLQGIKISDVKIQCGSANSCSVRTIRFTVTNLLQHPVNQISFGWMFPTAEVKGCPSNIATKHTDYMSVLQPGEKAPVTILALNAPETNDGRYCLGVTDFNSPFR